MKCIDELKKIGIDKVSAKTRITQDKIQDIIDFKFDAFNKTRALGFTQIITRDFGVDLSEWLAAYNDYHSSTEQVEATENNSIDEISKNINIPIESDKKDKSYIALIVLLIVLVVLFMGFFVYNNFISSDSPKSANQSTLTPLQQIQKQNQMDLANNADSTPNVADLGESNQSDSNQNEISQNPQVDSKADSQVDSTETQENINADSQQKSANVPTSSASANQARINAQADELIITPNEPLWVGIIDLKTHRKKQLSIDAQQSFLLDGDKLIRTGHSYFSLSSGTNFAKQYIGGDNKYFLYRVEGGLREISKAEFLELNKGEEW